MVVVVLIIFSLWYCWTLKLPSIVTSLSKIASFPTYNLSFNDKSVLNIALPSTFNVPAIAVLPLAAVTTNLSVLIFVSPKIWVSPVVPKTVNLSESPTINWESVHKYPVFLKLPFVCVIETLLVPPDFINKLSLIIVSPSTVNEPPNEEAPVPTVKVFASATLTLSFNVVAPSTVNEPPNEEAPFPTVNVFASATLTLSFNVVAPSTVNEPPNEEAPFPTVKVFPAAILTLSFNVVAPVTVNVPPTLALSDNVVTPVTPKVPPTVALSDIVVAPVTANVPAIDVFPVAPATVKLVPFTARSLVTDNVPPTLVFPEAATTSNLFVSTVKFPPTPKVPPTVAASDKVVTPVTPNVPAIEVLPLAAVTTNLSVLIFVSPPIFVSPVVPKTLNLSVSPIINWESLHKYPVFLKFPFVCVIETLLVPPDFTNKLLLIIVSPSTVNEPPNVEAPVTSNVLDNVVAPVADNVPSVLISPDVAAIIALLVAPLTTCNPLLKTAFWAKVEVLLAVNTPWTVRPAADSNVPPFAPILVKDGNPVIAPCVLDVTVAAEPLTLPVTLPVIFPVDLIVPTTVKSPPMDTSLITNNLLFILTSKLKSAEPPPPPIIAADGIEASANEVVPVTIKSLACNALLNEASPTTSKRPPMDTSLITNNLLFMLISFVKSTPTFPSIASALIEAAAKVVVPVTTKSWACNVLLNEASPTTVKSPPMDKSLLTNKRLFILTSKRKLGEPEDVDATSPTIADAGIEASGTLILPETVILFAVILFTLVFPETPNVVKTVEPVIVMSVPSNVKPLIIPLVVIFWPPGNRRWPSRSSVILSAPDVKNDNVSLSEVVSALIYVSWSISVTPPKEAHVFPAP